MAEVWQERPLPCRTRLLWLGIDGLLVNGQPAVEHGAYLAWFIALQATTAGTGLERGPAGAPSVAPALGPASRGDRRSSRRANLSGAGGVATTASSI